MGNKHKPNHNKHDPNHYKHEPNHDKHEPNRNTHESKTRHSKKSLKIMCQDYIEIFVAFS